MVAGTVKTVLALVGASVAASLAVYLYLRRHRLSTEMSTADSKAASQDEAAIEKLTGAIDQLRPTAPDVSDASGSAPACSATGAPASAPGADAVEKVRELLDNRLRVTLTDNRVLVGKFSCFDKQRNVLLSQTVEQRWDDGITTELDRVPDMERNLGLVLIPRKWVVAVHAVEDEFS